MSNEYHISTNGTNTLISGAGTLDRVDINSRGLSSSATLYDSTTGGGTEIAVIDTTVETTLNYQGAFATGLTVVTTGTDPADLTIVVN